MIVRVNGSLAGALFLVLREPREYRGISLIKTSPPRDHHRVLRIGLL
jgi:hypothetical protein